MTAKQRFLQRKEDVKFHAELVHKTEFLMALDAALLQYQESLGDSKDITSASATAWRVEGARGLITAFLGLSSTPTVTKHEDRSTLNRV
jgi:hypothetical protein